MEKNAEKNDLRKKWKKMQKKMICRICVVMLLFSSLVHANDLNSLFEQVGG